VAVAVEAARLMIDFLTTGRVNFAVNMSPLEKAESAEWLYHLDMARRLGLLHARMDRGAVREVKLHNRGDSRRPEHSARHRRVRPPGCSNTRWSRA
jgi:D-3-phosphoglycerate dehydrogenase